MSAAPSPLRFLVPAWFSLVMGLGGLSLAWQAAQPVLGDAATGVGLVLALLATGLFVLLAGASLRRWQRHPQALAEDLAHPVRHAFVATVPVSLLLLAALGLALGVPSAGLQVLWWAGSLGQLWATLWVLGRWLGPHVGPASPWTAVTPVLFIPVVGNVAAPLAGVGLGHEAWSAAQLGIGALFWPLVLGLVLVRRFAHGPLPDRLLPTWFIAVAPPAVIGLALLTFEGTPMPLVVGCWGVAAFSAAWAGTQARRMVSQPFGLPFWALSFPLAALSGLTLQLGTRAALPAWSQAGVLVLALTSLVVVGLVLGTWRGLRQGTLLAPEPVATIQVATP